MTANDPPREPRPAQALVVPEAAPHAVRTHRGAELVALSERFNHGIFMAALAFVALSTVTALAFLPLRASAENGRPPSSAVAAGLIVLALTAIAARRGPEVYRLLRNRPGLQLVPVLIAAVLLSVVSPLRNELWWPACAILMVIALLISLRRALAYCLIVLLANLAAHIVAGDLSDTSPVGIVGLWIGLPFWTAMAAVIPQRMASHLLRLNANRVPSHPAARRVEVGSLVPPDEAPRNEDGSAADTAPDARGSTDATPTPARPGIGHGIDRLTSKQLQVVALLADGHRYEFIGECLSISAGQVYRHVRNAIERLGVENVNQLVAAAVAEGLVPRRERSASGRT